MEKVSVVIPTLNRESFLGPAVSDLLKQDYPNFEIVVVDQGENPSPEMLSLAKDNPGKLIYHHVKFRGLPLARNFGWQNATGAIILYLDDDIRCNDQLIKNHAATYKNSKVAVVAGGMDEPNLNLKENPKTTGVFSYWTASPTAGFQSRKHKEVQHARGANFSVRKDVIIEMGGFDETFTKGAALYEELEFCLKVKQKDYQIFFNPDARITHLVAPTGGCRVPQLDRYLKSLSRNRTIIILRYLTWYQKPVAFLRLLLLNLSYIRSERKPSALISSFQGFLEGLTDGPAPRIVSKL